MTYSSRERKRSEVVSTYCVKFIFRVEDHPGMPAERMADALDEVLMVTINSLLYEFDQPRGQTAYFVSRLATDNSEATIFLDLTAEGAAAFVDKLKDIFIRIGSVMVNVIEYGGKVEEVEDNRRSTS